LRRRSYVTSHISTPLLSSHNVTKCLTPPLVRDAIYGRPLGLRNKPVWSRCFYRSSVMASDCW